MRVAKWQVGNGSWQHFQAAIKAGRGGSGGRLPRGGGQLSAFPTDDASQLPGEWEGDVANASHVIYHYGTPVAWIDGRDGSWVVPGESYSPTTSGCQKRIRDAVGSYRETPQG